MAMKRDAVGEETISVLGCLEIQGPMRNAYAPVLTAPRRPHERHALIRKHTKAYLENFVKIANAVAERNGMTDRLEIAGVQVPHGEMLLEEMWKSFHRTGDMFADVPGAVLHDDKIEAAMQLADALRGEQHVRFSAETQWGKTLTLILATALHSMWCYTNRPEEMAVMINPAKRTGDAQTRHDYANFVSINRSIQLEGSDSIGGLVEQGLLFDCTRRSATRFVNKIIEEARRRNASIVTIVLDEADEAAAIRSIIDRMITTLERQGFSVRLLVCTATGYVFEKLTHQGTYIEIEAEVLPDSGYCGYYVGERLPIHAYSRLAHLTKHRIFEDFCMKLFRERASRVRGSKDRAKHVAAELRDLASGMADVFINPPNSEEGRSLGFNGLRFNGGRGAFIRFDNGSRTDAFVREAAPIFRKAGIELLTFYDRGNKADDTISAFIEHFMEANPDQYFVVVVKGTGRRADRIPKAVTLFFDFTKESSQVAAEQGTVGRATGWHVMLPHRSRIVFLSDENAMHVAENRQQFDETGQRFSPSRSIGPNVVKTEESKNSVRKLVADVTIDLSEFPDLHRIIDLVVTPHIRPDNRRDSRLMHLKDNGDGDRRFGMNAKMGKRGDLRIFDMVSMFAPHRDAINTMLQRRYGPDAELLLPGDDQIGNGDQYYANLHNGHTLIEARDIDKYQTKGMMQERHGNDRPTILNGDGATPGRGRHLQIQFSAKTGVLTAKRMRLLLTKVVTVYSEHLRNGGCMTEAAETSMYARDQG